MILRVLNSAMALLFAWAAALNFNDPDPIQWVGIYGVAMTLSALAAWRPALLPWFAPAIVGGVALAWAASIAPRALGMIPLGRMVESWEMKSAVVEENREMFGLLIVAAWMLVLVIARLRVGGR